MDYEMIKEVAARTGRKVTDLLALSPQNDPFYVGTERDLKMANWFREVWDLAGYSRGVHLRRVHYFCVSRSDIRLPMAIKQGEEVSDRYLNTEAAWKFLTQASKVARYLGLVQIEQIVDNKNPDPVIRTWFNHYFEQDDDEAERKLYSVQMGGIQDPYVSVSGPSSSDVQPYLLEVWLEKGTMNDVLASTCNRFEINLVSFQGEASITAVLDLIKRVQQAGKPAVIFYVSDFDPAGNSMPKAVARKIEWMRENYGVMEQVLLKPIALTKEQVAHYRLPRTPIKDSELRAGRFEAAFGEGAVELDALEALYPGSLATILQNEAERFYDRAAEDARRATEWAVQSRVRAAVRAALEEHQELLDQLAALQEEIANIQVDTGDLEFSRSDLDPWYDRDEFLFDSDRNYIQQIRYYAAHKNGTEV